MQCYDGAFDSPGQFCQLKSRENVNEKCANNNIPIELDFIQSKNKNKS